MTETTRGDAEAVRIGLRDFLAAFLPPWQADQEVVRLVRDAPHAGATELLSMATTQLRREHHAPEDVLVAVLTEDIGLSARTASVLVASSWGSMPTLDDPRLEDLFTSHPRRTVTETARPDDAVGVRSTVPEVGAAADLARARPSWLVPLVMVGVLLVLVLGVARPFDGPETEDDAPATTVTLIEARTSSSALPGAARPDADVRAFGAGPVVLWFRVEVGAPTSLSVRWNAPDGRVRTTSIDVDAGTLDLTATLPDADKRVPGTYGVQVSDGEALLLTRTFEVMP